MGNVRRTKKQLILAEDEALRRLMLGDSMAEIAVRLGVTERRAYSYIEKAKERQKLELLRLDGRASVLRQFFVLDYALQEALNAYERSKNPKVTKATKVERSQAKQNGSAGPGGAFGDDSESGEYPVGPVHEKVSTQKAEELREGNPAFLDRILKASKELRELLGMDAEKVQRVILRTGEIEDGEDIGNLSAEELYSKYKDALGRSPKAE